MFPSPSSPPPTPTPTPLCTLYQFCRFDNCAKLGEYDTRNLKVMYVVVTILRRDKDARVLLVRVFVRFDTKLHINMCYVRRDLDSREAGSENQKMTTTLMIPFSEGGLLVCAAKQ